MALITSRCFSQSVRIGVGLWVDQSDSDEPPPEPEPRRRRRPHTAGPGRSKNRRAHNDSSGSSALLASTGHLSHVDLTVLQGDENPTMPLTVGTLLRSAERNQSGEPTLERKGGRRPFDPNRMSRKFYETHISGFGDTFRRPDADSQLLEEEDLSPRALAAGEIDWTTGRDWMDDARPIEPELGSDEEEELAAAVAAAHVSIDMHTAFNDTLRNDKDWGSNKTSAGPAAYQPVSHGPQLQSLWIIPMDNPYG